MGSRRVRREAIVAVGEASNQGRKVGLSREGTAGADQPTGAVESARLELTPKQPVALVRPGQPQRAGLLAGETEPGVIGRVADQQHGAMAATCGLPQRVVHQRRADARLRRSAPTASGPDRTARPAGPAAPRPSRTRPTARPAPPAPNPPPRSP